MRNSILWGARFAALSLFLLKLPLTAQNSQLAGRITDSSQAVVSTALVAVTRTDSGLKREVLSNDQGFYVVPLLPPGLYEVAVTKAGFKPLTRTGIVLETGITSTVDLQLEVGGVNETVTVEAAVPLLQLETSSVAHVVESRSIENLPLIDRRAAQLIRLNGFVVQNGSGSQFGIAGGRGDNAMWTMDGESTQNLPNIGVAILAYDPPVESLQEFNVAVSNYAAELGRTGGGVVQMTTKSGTNELHGSLYEYFRNDALTARTFFSAQKPILRYNLFGASLGGPIRKNKTFFFYNYEGLRQTIGVTQVLGVPTIAETQGDFSKDPTIIKYPVTHQPFPGNIIPANRLDTVGARIAALYPAPNVAGQPSGNANFRANQPQGTTPNNHIVRIDHSFREKDRIFGRFVAYTVPSYTGAVFTAAGADPFGVQAHTSYYNVTGTWYHDFSPTVLNELRTGFDLRSSHTFSSGAGSGINGQIGLTGVDPKFAPSVVVPGYTAIGSASFTQQREQVPTLAVPLIEHLTVIRGRHQFKFGVEYRYASDIDIWRGLAGGQLNFNSTAAGNSLAALLLGWPLSGQIVDALPLKPRGNNYNGFAQDDWKVTPNLTLNLGIRYDLDQPRWEEYDNRQNSFNTTAINPVSGTPGIVTFSGRNGVSKYASDWDKNNFGPRFGIAWRLPKNFVIRGGAGLLYVGPYDMATPITANLGFSKSATFVSPDNGVTAPFLLSQGFPLVTVPAEAQLTPGYGAVALGNRPITAPTFYQPTNRGTGYLEQFNFNIQKQLANSVLLEIGALGTFGHANPVPNQSGVTINQVPTELLGPGNAQLKRPFPQFSDVRLLAAEIGSSKYYGFNLHVEKRASNGLSIQGNYTFSRFEDNVPGRDELGDPGGSLSFYNTYLNMYNRRADWGLSGNDIKHRFIASVIYELPYGKGKAHAPANAFLNQVAGGWSLAYIGELHSGSPYGVMEAVNLTNSFSDGNRPNVVGDPTISGSRSRAQQIAEWFNVNAFAAPAKYTFGNAGRTAGYGPGVISMDLSMLKDFTFRERHAIQFRVEALNFINNPNFALPNVQQGSASFGRITSLIPGNQSRILQLGLHYKF